MLEFAAIGAIVSCCAVPAVSGAVAWVAGKRSGRKKEFVTPDKQPRRSEISSEVGLGQDD